MVHQHGLERGHRDRPLPSSPRLRAYERQLPGGSESGALAKAFDLIANLRTGLLESCKQASLDPAIVLGFERVVQLLGGAGAIDHEAEGLVVVLLG